MLSNVNRDEFCTKNGKKDKTLENRANFEQVRSDANTQANEKRCSYYQDSIKSSSGSQKELFNVFNHLLDNNKKSQLPFSEDHHTLANRFNNYFVQKIENIRNNLDIPVVDICCELLPCMRMLDGSIGTQK